MGWRAVARAGIVGAQTVRVIKLAVCCVKYLVRKLFAISDEEANDVITAALLWGRHRRILDAQELSECVPVVLLPPLLLLYLLLQVLLPDNAFIVDCSNTRIHTTISSSSTSG